MRVRDLPVAGRMTFLCWRKWRFWCEACGRTFTETHPALPSRQRVSARFRGHLFDCCHGSGAHAEVARDEHTTRYQVQTAFLLAGDELLARRQTGPPRRLSLDEAHHRRGRELATVVSDLDRWRVIDVIAGCTRKVIERWLTALPDDLRAGIEVVSIDPSEAHRQAIWTALPDARIVCDRFHLVRGASAALDAVRRERQRNGAPRSPAEGRGPQRPTHPLAPRALPRPAPAAQGLRAPNSTPTSAVVPAVSDRSRDRRGAPMCGETAAYGHTGQTIPGLRLVGVFQLSLPGVGAQGSLPAHLPSRATA